MRQKDGTTSTVPVPEKLDFSRAEGKVVITSPLFVSHIIY